ncbi:DUF6531 domain-containing protein [Streptomyces sp. NPDC001820]|uniref:DUF6531 domain-containing protein n=1 Tax=Streptomyces sp. NPDC001820 TaxID=3364613 RepID=UPI003675C58B
MLDVVGVGWPNVDEDAYRDMADALREFADDAEDDGHAAHQHIQRLLSSGQSESLTALDKHWSKVQGKHKDLAKAARIIAGALDRVADIIVARKIAAVGELADLCATVGITLAFAPVTAGLSTLLAGAKIVATRIAFKRILKEMAEAAVSEIVATLTQPAVAAIENVVADLAIQTALNVTGVQDGYNTDQTVQAGKDGLQLNSAPGPGGSGPGGGPVIDHDAHGKAGMHLAGVQISMRDKAGGKLGKAKGHHGRAKGKDSLTAVLDTTIEGVTEKLGKALNDLGEHVGKKLPDAITKGSKTHKDTDHDVRDRVKSIVSNDGKDDGLGGRRRSSGDERRRVSDDTRVKPNSLDSAKDDARRNAVSLEKKTCKNDPVDVATGEMTLPQTDLSLPGVLPFVLRRTHLSEYRWGRWFGRSWASALDERIELDPNGKGAIWAREDGSLLIYAGLPAPGDTYGILPLEGPGLALMYEGQENASTTYRITDPFSKSTRYFTGSPYNESPAYWLSEVRDRNDNHVSFARRPDGAPVSVAHSGGYRVQLTADSSRVTALAVRGPSGTVTLLDYGYDAAGDLTDLTGPVGRPMRFTYDADGRITSWTDRNLSTFQYVYDDGGRVIRTIGPDGFLSSTFAYDIEAESGHRVVRYTDSTGATTVVRLNDRLQVVAETDPLGNTTVQAWGPDDRLISRTDPLGHTTELTWDDTGNLTSVQLPDGALATARYNALGLPVEVTTAEGTVWQQTFDELGNCTSTRSPDGSVTRFTHDRTGAVASITDALGAVTRIRADRAGLPLEITDAGHHVTRVVRDHLGRPTRITDAMGGTEHFEWDAEDRLLSRILKDGSREVWTWDGEGNCLTHTDAHGGVTAAEYGHFDKPITRTSADGARYELRYDTELRLERVSNPLGQTWDYAYDHAGRLAGESDFDGRETQYTYDAAGRLGTRTTPLGQTFTYAWDAMDRLVAQDSAGSVTRYTYSTGGQLIGAESQASTLTMERDVMGRLVAETVDGRTSRYTYDLLGRRLTRTTPTGAVSRLEYNAEGDRVRLTTDGHALAFTHDVLGRELSQSWGTLQEPVALDTAWDTRSRPTHRSLTAGGVTLRGREYVYRADSCPVSLTESTADSRRDMNLSLDPLGRPVAVEAPGWREHYTYDAAGNQTSADWPEASGHTDARGRRDYDGGHLISAGSIRYEHDAAGRVVMRRRTRLSRKSDIWRYQYDAEDRLISCTTPDGTLWRYAYEPLGRRTAKLRMAADGRTVAETVHFTWDGTHLAEQSDTATGTVVTWEYEGNKPLAQYERRMPGNEETDARFFAIVSDLVGTPTELVSETGDTAWRSRSTCWGTTAWNKGATAYTPLRFPGQYADPETGLHYNYFRHYDPDTARYTSLDPLGLSPAPNPSTYVLNPWTWTDPLGLAPKRCQMDAYDWKGSVRYGRLDHLGRPTGVNAQLRPEMLRTGTEAGSLWPPGWRGNGTAFNEARGHLLADRLGGAGKGRLAYHNLVTQTQTPTNSPDQRDQVEQVIFDAVKTGEIVQYNVKPIYEGTNPIPIRIDFTAFGNRGFSFTHSLDNPAAGIRTGV